MCICGYWYICIYVWMYVYVCVCVCIHIYIYEVPMCINCHIAEIHRTSTSSITFFILSNPMMEQ